MTQAPPTPPVEQCPHCGAEAGPNQEYCLDCGTRLSAAESGVVPQLAAAWQRRLPWYPGDWIWPAGLGLVLASAGATTPAAPKPSGGLVQWPVGQNGYTVVIESLPSGGGGQAAALRKARAAVAAGLPQVGVLDSGRFSSLHPGYAVVFSGFYASLAQAQSAANAAAAKGFGSAYARQITT